MSTLDAQDRLFAEQAWIRIGVVVVTIVLCLQAAGGGVRSVVVDTPSRLELVQTCLVERSTPFGAASQDLIALSASRGALTATVEGNRVTIALAGSDSEAQRLVDAYATVASTEVVRTLLDRRRKVVFLWEREPTASQREFAYLCTLDAQS